MVFTPPLRMPIEIREGIAESESEELLLHAPFVQHATRRRIRAAALLIAIQSGAIAHATSE
jgi:hypothetical protein